MLRGLTVAVKAYLALNPDRCLRMVHMPMTQLDALDDAALARTQVPRAIEVAEDDLSDEMIVLSCMRGADVDHVIHQFLIPILAAVDGGRKWTTSAWVEMFARSVAGRIGFTPVAPRFRAAEALIDGIGFVGDEACAAHFEADDFLRRAREFTGADLELLECVDASPVLARIQMISMFASEQSLVFDELSTVLWPRVVESILIPVLAVDYTARAATNTLVTRMLQAETSYLIRGAWLDALDDADVASLVTELAPFALIMPRRLMPALICARATPDAQILPRARGILAELARGTLAVPDETVQNLLAKLPSTMLDVATEAREYALATRAAAHLQTLRADLVHVALALCAASQGTARLRAQIHALVRGAFASDSELESVCAFVIRNGAVHALATELDERTFDEMCDAMAAHDQHARLSMLLAHADRGTMIHPKVNRARRTIERVMFECIQAH